MKKFEKAFNSNKFLNFKFKDSNEDMQRLNFYLYGVSILNIVVFLISVIPIILFSITFFIDPNLNYYFDNLDKLQEVLKLPSKTSILIPLVFSWIFIVLSLCLILLIKPFITSIRIKNVYKNSFWITLLSLEIIAFLFASFSQYNHTIYQDFFNFESRVSGSIASSNATINDVSAFFTKNIDSAYIWTTEDGIWWIMFAQFATVFMLSLSIQNAIIVDVKQLNIDKYISYYSEREKEFNNSRLRYFFAKAFNRSDRTLTIWTIVVSCCILIPSFVYILGISFNTTPVAKLGSFINSFPNLMNRFDGSQQVSSEFNNLLNFSNRYFNYSSLPVIVMGITTSTLFYFVSVSIRGEKKVQSNFLSRYIIIGIELLAVLVVTFYSQLEVNQLIKTWNQQTTDGKTTGALFLEKVNALFSNEDDFKKISDFYDLDAFNTGVKRTFFGQTNFVVINILAISLLASSYTIIGKCVFDKSNFKKKISLRLKHKATLEG